MDAADQITMMEARREAQQKGQRARREGLSLAQNPYRMDPDGAEAWEQGWKEEDSQST